MQAVGGAVGEEEISAPDTLLNQKSRVLLVAEERFNDASHFSPLYIIIIAALYTMCVASQ